MKKYTIGVPTHRGAKRLRLLLQSIERVESSDFKVFIVDDGSPREDFNDVLDVIDSRFPVLHFPVNRGLPTAYNALKEHCGTRYLCLFDDDTLIPADFFSVLDHIFDNNDLTIAVAGFVSEKRFPKEMERMAEQGFASSGSNVPPEFATQLAGQCFCLDMRIPIEFDPRYRFYIQDSDFCCQAADKFSIPSYRFHYPVIPHLEHGTLGKYEELGAAKQVNLDIQAFVTKWGMKPEEKEETLVSKFTFNEIKWMYRNSEFSGRPFYKGKSL